MNKCRFSMLLLEPGEIYFEDYSCSMHDDLSLKKGIIRQGRLKLCSKSLVFEPRNFMEPLLKIHFKECLNISTVPSKINKTCNVIQIKAKQYCEMLEENILTPYKFQYKVKDFFFIFDFASAEECLNQMQQLLRASTLHAPEHNSMVATILYSRYMRMVFDPVMMDDFTEKIIYEFQVEKISPLVRHQGKLALTPTTLYFQPISNIENSPILKVKLKDINRMYNRRFLLRQVGLEIYCLNQSSIRHIYLLFLSEDERNTVYEFIESLPNNNLEQVHIEEMTLRWQNGIVSNYDYLVYLNCLADRSKNDLTQYPVFPWIVSDYTSETLDLDSLETFRDLSKPMGALNKDRLEKLLERYQEMSEPKFLYGSHYSAPGLVLFYLVRKYPQYMLCLQNGRFDHPDRMFNSVGHVYHNCMKNMSDFKELVPEFYDTREKGDFLVNMYDIDFGVRHDGRKVDNVELPPWASSPEDFVTKLREALESDYVSRHIHLWIDLIFGYKQRGNEAVKANNVFHHVCYEGSVDLELICDMNDKHALEVQIMEFGQVPKQLFTQPHVKKIIHQVLKSISDVTPPPPVDGYDMELLDTVRLHKEAVTCAICDKNRVISVGKDGALKVYDMEQNKQIRSVILCSTPLSSCVMVDENLVAAGSWDNEIYLYDVEYGRVMDSFRAHDDSVSCLMWLPQERLLVSGGWDAVVRVWGNLGNTGQALRGLKAELDHDGNITTIAHRYRGDKLDVISGTVDGEVVVWEVSTGAALVRARTLSAPLAACTLTHERTVCAARDGLFNVTDLNVMNVIFEKRVSTTLTAVRGDGGHVVWLGAAAGALLQWNMETVTQTDERTIHEDEIESIYFDKSSNRLITASKDRSVKIWRLSSDC
ncbi:protein FAN-like [Aricia agestis]|uniref:protein FAN-like n=1 Tax=Aricia agestis TaxID=91739 RepID=UPI001C2075B2|nr:protein FAN-like [Aricia agestis]